MVGRLDLDLNLELKAEHNDWRYKSPAQPATCHRLECEDERRWTAVGTEGETGQGRGRAGRSGPKARPPASKSRRRTNILTPSIERLAGSCGRIFENLSSRIFPGELALRAKWWTRDSLTRSSRR